MLAYIFVPDNESLNELEKPKKVLNNKYTKSDKDEFIL